MVAEISPEEFRSLLASDADLRVADVRTKIAYDRGHIPGSEHVPLHSISEHVADLADASIIVTVCPHGEASKQAVTLIRSYEGIDEDTRVASLSGGLDAWDEELEASD